MEQEGKLFKPNEIDADLREKLETLKRYANVERDKCDELIHEKEKELEEYKNLRKKISDFPKVLRREDWLPINDYAFIQGTYDNTNKFYTLLGSQYFAERSAAQTVEFIDRRIKGISDVKDGYEKQKELAKSRLEFAENLFEQQNSDVVEIREPYDAEKLRTKMQPKEAVSDKDFEKIMSRLDELEKEEENKEKTEIIEKPKEVKSATVAEQEKINTEKVVAPKGVSQEEFEKLIKRVDEMIESSDDEEDYEDEDMSEEEEGALDSDDSLPESVKAVAKNEPKQVKSNSPVKESKKSGVRFSSELEAGPTVASAEKSSSTPKPILRNKDERTPVDEAALKAMNEVEPERTILPATDAFKGVFVERNIHDLEPSTSAAAEQKKPISKFKAKRLNL